MRRISSEHQQKDVLQDSTKGAAIEFLGIAHAHTHDLFEPRVSFAMLMFSFSPLRAPPLNNDHRSQNGSFAASWMDDDAIALFLFPLLRPLCVFFPFLFFANCLVRLHPTWPLRSKTLLVFHFFALISGLFTQRNIYTLRAPKLLAREINFAPPWSATRTLTHKSPEINLQC